MGIECGISKLIIEIDPMGVLPLIQLHFQPMPLGLPKNINGKVVMALTLTFDGRTLERLRNAGYPRRALVTAMERPTHCMHKAWPQSRLAFSTAAAYCRRPP